MKRRLGTACVTLLLAALPALATCAPLSDVGRGDWAYQAIQTLAADGIIDGYPDGTFRGDRPPTRNEMAALTARAIAKVEADGAPKADLQSVQQLIDALKDELDALGVRVTNIEEGLGQFQGRTTVPPRPMPRADVLRAKQRARAGFSANSARVLRDDRPLTRDEMAILATRVIARVEADSTTKIDVERVQRRLDALKDRLDALGVRVTNIQAIVGSSDDRTKLARRSSLHVDVGQESFSAVTGGNLANFPARSEEINSLPCALAGLAFSAREATVNPPDGTQSYVNGASASGGLKGLSDLYFSVSRVDRTLLDSGPTTVRLPRSGALFLSRIFNVEGAQLPESVVAGADNANLIGEAVFGIHPALAGFALLRASLYAADVKSSYAPGYRNVIAPVLFDPATHVDVAGAPRQNFAFVSDILALGAHPSLPRFFAAADALTFDGNLRTPTTFEPTQPASIKPTPSQALPLLRTFETYEPNLYAPIVPQTQGLHVALSVPVRFGGVVLRGNFGAAHLQEATSNSLDAFRYCAGLTTGCAFAPGQRASDDQLSAGTTFDIRALGRRISLKLGGSYERLYRPDATTFSYVPYDPTSESLDAATLAPLASGNGPLTFNPNYVNVFRRAVNAAAGVPLTSDLTLNLQYNTQYYTGSYETLGQNIDGRKDFYLGNLTYTIPRTSSSIAFSAKQYHYRDAFVPTYNVTQNRADLNFTIKF